MSQLPFAIENYNLFTENKWFCHIGFSSLKSDLGYDDLILNLVSTGIPQLIIPETEMGIMGTSIPIPSLVRKETKTLSFNYLLSSNLLQYRQLYKWFSLYANEKGSSNVGIMNPSKSVDVTVFFIDEYKKPIVGITFHGCWINSLNSLDLTYISANELKHAFAVKYQWFEFLEDL